MARINFFLCSASLWFTEGGGFVGSFITGASFFCSLCTNDLAPNSDSSAILKSTAGTFLLCYTIIKSVCFFFCHITTLCHWFSGLLQQAVRAVFSLLYPMIFYRNPTHQLDYYSSLLQKRTSWHKNLPT